MNKAIFIEKDGVLIRNIPNNVDPKLITLNEGVVEGLKIFQELGYFLMIITNQSGIAFGHFKSHGLKKAVKRIEDLLKYQGVYIDGFLYCPHHPEGIVEKYSMECECRKPKPGLLYRAAKNFNINLSNSWMVGDGLNDIETGNKAGCKTILINKDNGNETEWLLNDIRKPTYIASDMKEAATYIANEDGEKKILKTVDELI